MKGIEAMLKRKIESLFVSPAKAKLSSNMVWEPTLEDTHGMIIIL